MNLFGKTAIVTGAARGLGRAYATRLFEVGMNVVAADKADCEATVAAMYGPGKARAVTVDVADFASCEAMARSAAEAFGGVDVLINNAALYGGLHGGRLETLDEAEWDKCMAVNVKGVWNCVRAVLPSMRARGGGSIVNIASLAAVSGLPYALHYSASKGAVIAMTRSMARELGRDNIRVNAMAPTAVQTEGTNAFFGERTESALETIRDSQILKRTPEADDLVGTMLYLAGDASRFVTGQTIMVDGGSVFT